MTQQIIRSIGSDGKDVLSNILDKDTGKLIEFKEVSEYYDGTPMSDDKLDVERYLYIKNNGKYYLRVLDNPDKFLEKDTMLDMRNISNTEILLLKMGYYKGVKLNGYYVKGDTPAPIEYYLSDMEDEDDGGSVIDVSSIKLEHKFDGFINCKYFGCVLDGITDNLIQFQECLNKSGVIYIPSGKLAVSDTLNVLSDTRVLGDDKYTSTLMWKDNSVSPGHTSDENFLLTVRGQNNIVFENINLDANGFNQDDIFRNSILELRDSSSNIRINNVFFRNAFDTLAYGGFGLVSWYGGANNVTISEVYFDKIGQSDLGIFEGENWQVNGLYSTNNTYMSINIETSNLSKYLRNINITNVVVSDCKRSIISLIHNAVSVGIMENINITNIIGTRISNNDNQVGCIRFRGGKSINISNVTLNDSGGTGIRMTVDSNQSVENVNISNVVINNITSSLVGYGISVEGTSAYPCKNITFDNIKIVGSVSAGFNATYLNNSTIKDVTVQSPKLTVRGFEIKNSKFLNMLGCRTINTSSTALGLTDCDTVNLSNTNILDAVGVGIYVSGTTTNLICNSNSVSDSRTPKLITTGIRLETSITKPRISLFGNNFYGILNPVDGNMISIASNIVQDNIIQMGNSSTTPFRSSTTYVKGIVNQSTASADSASAPSTNYTQSEVQAILTELRDLKTKLRTAGILAPNTP